MQRRALVRKREKALERRIGAIERRWPGLVESISANGYREMPPAAKEIAEKAVSKIRSEIDPFYEAIRMMDSENMGDAMDACALITFTHRSVAVDALEKGLESEKRFVRKACAKTLSDLFLTSSREESWEALGILVKANDMYVAEATEELAVLFDIDSANGRAVAESLLKRAHDLISKPTVSASIGATVITLMRCGLIKTGLVVFGFTLAFGIIEKRIRKSGRKKFKSEFLRSRASDLLEEPQTI